MRGPRHGNGRPHLIGRKNTNPLRAIVATEHDECGARIEVLECGHKQRQRQDMIGPTNAYRRRCRHCAPHDGSGAGRKEEP